MTTRRLPQYSTYEEIWSLFSKTELSFTKTKTNRLLRYSNNLLTSKEGTFRPRDERQFDYHSTRRNNSRQLHKKNNQPIGHQLKKKYYTSQCSKVLQWTHIHTKELYNSCLSFRRWLQATDNLISDGLYFCDVFRESLLRTANGHPITNKGQVRRREKGFD